MGDDIDDGGYDCRYDDECGDTETFADLWHGGIRLDEPRGPFRHCQGDWFAFGPIEDDGDEPNPPWTQAYRRAYNLALKRAGRARDSHMADAHDVHSDSSDGGRPGRHPKRRHSGIVYNDAQSDPYNPTPMPRHLLSPNAPAGSQGHGTHGQSASSARARPPFIPPGMPTM